MNPRKVELLAGDLRAALVNGAKSFKGGRSGASEKLVGGGYISLENGNGGTIVPQPEDLANEGMTLVALSKLLSRKEENSSKSYVSRGAQENIDCGSHAVRSELLVVCSLFEKDLGNSFTFPRRLSSLAIFFWENKSA